MEQPLESQTPSTGFLASVLPITDRWGILYVYIEVYFYFYSYNMFSIKIQLIKYIRNLSFNKKVNSPIPDILTTIFLGSVIIFDCKQDFKYQIEVVFNKIFGIDLWTLKQLNFATVQSVLTYGLAGWGGQTSVDLNFHHSKGSKPNTNYCRVAHHTGSPSDGVVSVWDIML